MTGKPKKLSLSGTGKLSLGAGGMRSGRSTKAHPNDIGKKQFFVQLQARDDCEHYNKWLMYPVSLNNGVPYNIRKNVSIEVRRKRINELANALSKKSKEQSTTMEIALDTAKKKLLNVYDDFDDLPLWVRGKIAVLQMLINDSEWVQSLFGSWTNPIEGVGSAKSDRKVYLIVRGDDDENER